MPRSTRPRFRPAAASAGPFLLALAVLALAAACGSGDDDDDSEANGTSSAPAQTVDFSALAVGEAFDPEVQPNVINSALGVGKNRLTIGIFNSSQGLVQDATGTLRLYRVDDAGEEGTFVEAHALERASIISESEHEHADGSTHIHEDPFATIYYAPVEFDAAGRWGLVLDLEVGGQRHEVQTDDFIVLDDTPEPSIGDAMPASENLTLRDVDDVSEIDSSEEPIEAFHELTVAEALETGKPVLVAIATPAFCQTRFCGPMLDQVVVPLYEEFGDNVAFVHVEPFLLDEARNNQRLVPVPLMQEWGLLSEPWIFIAGRDGTITAKFEGIASLDEVRDALTAATMTNPEK